MSDLSVELRELEAKLKAGFMNRERSAQLAEKQVMEQDRKVLYLCITCNMYHFKLTPMVIFYDSDTFSYNLHVNWFLKASSL